ITRFEACSAFTHVTACTLAESPKRPSTPKAPTTSLPPSLLRLLPGGANQFPGGLRSRCGPAPFTAHRIIRASFNTVHLTNLVAFCMRQGQEAIGGAYGCGTPSGCPDHGLHQSWRHHQDIPSFGHRPSAFEYWNSECSPAWPAGSGCSVLRGRSGAIHAVVLSGGIALFAGSGSVAA